MALWLKADEESHFKWKQGCVIYPSDHFNHLFSQFWSREWASFKRLLLLLFNVQLFELARLEPALEIYQALEVVHSVRKSSKIVAFYAYHFHPRIVDWNINGIFSQFGCSYKSLVCVGKVITFQLKESRNVVQPSKSNWNGNQTSFDSKGSQGSDNGKVSFKRHWHG